MGKPIGICGRAPEWLVECGIDSISLNPDTAIKTAFVIAKAEAREQRRSLPRMNARPAIAD